MRVMQLSALAIAPVLAAAAVSDDVAIRSAGCGKAPVEAIQLGARNTAKLASSGRSFTFWVPASYSHDTPAALVVAPVDVAADSDSSVVVYPGNRDDTVAIIHQLGQELCLDLAVVSQVESLVGGSSEEELVQEEEEEEVPELRRRQTRLDTIVWSTAGVPFPTSLPTFLIRTSVAAATTAAGQSGLSNPATDKNTLPAAATTGTAAVASTTASSSATGSGSSSGSSSVTATTTSSRPATATSNAAVALGPREGAVGVMGMVAAGVAAFAVL